jgi:hypothetical protein
MGFEVLIAEKMLMLILWVVAPCGIVGRYHYSIENILLPSSALKMEAVGCSETLVSIFKSTRC